MWTEVSKDIIVIISILQWLFKGVTEKFYL